MPFYPQLSSGNLLQFPLAKQLRRRIVENRLLDGSRIVQLSAEPLSRRWALSYSELSDAERTLLNQFHTAMEGRLRTFSFLDPTGNLLKWSEKLTNTVWSKAAGLEIVEGISSPNGSNRANRLNNPTSVTQQLKQTVSASGLFNYCFSFQARAAESTVVDILLGDGLNTISSNVRLETTWNKYWVSGSLQSSSDTVHFGIELPAGTSIEVFGMQSAAQIGPGEYLKTQAASAVYEKVRFADDQFSFTAQAQDNNSLTIHLTTTG